MGRSRGRISSACGPGTCVWVDRVDKCVQIGDTKQDSLLGGQVVITVDSDTFDRFQRDLIEDRPVSDHSDLLLTVTPDGTRTLQQLSTSKILVFDRHEWDAFVLGVQLDEFTAESFMQPV